MSILEILLLIFTIVILILAGVYAVLAAAKLTNVSGYDQDSKLKSAHTWLTWASVIIWIGVALIVFLIAWFIIDTITMPYILGPLEYFTGSWVVRIFLVFTVALLLLAGTFCALGSWDIFNSNNVVEARNSGAFEDAIIAAILAITGGLLVITVFLYSLFSKGYDFVKKQKEAYNLVNGQPNVGGIPPSQGFGGGEGGISQLQQQLALQQLLSSSQQSNELSRIRNLSGNPSLSSESEVPESLLNLPSVPSELPSLSSESEVPKSLLNLPSVPSELPSLEGVGELGAIGGEAAELAPLALFA